MSSKFNRVIRKGIKTPSLRKNPYLRTLKSLRKGARPLLKQIK